MLGWIIAGAVVVILLLWGVSSYNSFVKLRNLVEEAFSSMDVYLKKRYDLIPNVVETVKGYAKHESETLEKVIAARNTAASSADPEARMQNDNVLQGALRSLFAVAESYPDLKANTNFLDLQRQLKEIEGEIERARRYYNAAANRYNIKTESFPSNLIAGMFHFGRKPLYEVSAPEERENVKVQF
jgi:LemA protein